MRFLADAGISPRTIEFLRQRGHDAVHVRELAMQRATDRQVVEKAQASDRVLLTFDLDFEPSSPSSSIVDNGDLPADGRAS